MCSSIYYNANLRQAKAHITVKDTILNVSCKKPQCFKGNLGLHKAHFVLL